MRSWEVGAVVAAAQRFDGTHVRAPVRACACAPTAGVYSTIECYIEGARGTHDLTNSVSAGCVTGAALAYKSGPASMCFGCVGFAAFSVVIDKVMGPGF